MTITRTRPVPAVPPAPLSMFDPVYVEQDETGRPVHLDFADQVGIIVAGEPGAGKSVALANIVAHGALSCQDCRLTLIDGALVELGAWRSCADEFVGPDIGHAIAVLERQQQEITDCCARGRKCAYRYVIATQRPSTDIVPSSLRDLFGYRWAFRCATDDSSDVVLGRGAAKAGHTAAAIADESRGVGLLRAEGKRVPRRVKAAYLTDSDIRRIAAHAAIPVSYTHLTLPMIYSV